MVTTMKVLHEGNAFNLNMIIVLISGKAGVGKTLVSTIFKELVETLGFLDYTNMHFAKGVKDTATLQFGWDGEKDKKGRILLQEVGQTGRNYDEDIWARRLLEQGLDYCPAGFDFVFIDDWRFPNEAKYLRNNSSYEVLTVRISSPEREMLKGTAEYNDISEISLSEKPNEYDYYIYNDGTVGELRDKLAKILISIMKKKQEEKFNDGIT